MTDRGDLSMHYTDRAVLACLAYGDDDDMDGYSTMFSNLLNEIGDDIDMLRMCFSAAVACSAWLMTHATDRQHAIAEVQQRVANYLDEISQ